MATSREPRTDIPVRRISAFIYGNILVLSALVVLSPEVLRTTRGFVYVLGVGFSTFVAHVASDLFAHLLRDPDGKGLSERLRGDLRDAVPIATSAILPTVVLVAAWLGWLEADLSWAVAIGVMLVRLSHCGLDCAGTVFAVAAVRGRSARLVDRRSRPVESSAYALTLRPGGHRPRAITRRGRVRAAAGPG